MLNAHHVSPLRRLALLAALFGTLACSLTAPTTNTDPQRVALGEDPVVDLAAPLDGAAYLEGVPVNVIARVTNAGEDIDRVEVVVGDSIVSTVPVPNPAGAPAFSVSQSWTPDGPGAYQLALTVFRTDGSSASSPLRDVEVVGADGPPAESAPQTTEETLPTIPPAPETAATEELNVEPEPEQVEAEAEPETEEAAAPDEPEPETPADAAPEEQASGPPTAVITVGANVRAGPGTTFPVVGTLAANTETELLAVNGAGSWYKIRVYNGEGWIFSDLVTTTGDDQLPIDEGPPPPPPTATPVPATAVPPTAEPTNVNLTFDGPIQIDPFPPACGETMAFRINVENTGTSAFGSTATVVIRDVHIDSGTVTETRAPVPDLPAGGEASIDGIFLTVETNFDTQHRIEVILDADNQLSETNEDDNRSSGNEYTLTNEGGC